MNSFMYAKATQGMPARVSQGLPFTGFHQDNPDTIVTDSVLLEVPDKGLSSYILTPESSSLECEMTNQTRSYISNENNEGKYNNRNEERKYQYELSDVMDRDLLESPLVNSPIYINDPKSDQELILDQEIKYKQIMINELAKKKETLKNDCKFMRDNIKNIKNNITEIDAKNYHKKYNNKPIPLTSSHMRYNKGPWIDTNNRKVNNLYSNLSEGPIPNDDPINIMDKVKKTCRFEC